MSSSLNNPDDFTLTITYASESSSHDNAIDRLNEIAFGPGRFTRAAHLIRQNGDHDRALSFVALKGENLIGSVRITPIVVNDIRACLLGPIVVDAALKKSGIGSQLMHMAIEAVRNHGYPFILLVGDEPYYNRFGFHKVQKEKIIMPAPVNPERLLILELDEQLFHIIQGVVAHASTYRNDRI